MFNNKYMALAISRAKEAFLNNEVPVGAIIVNPKTEEIIAESYNLVEFKQDPTAHAEMLAIQLACQKLSSKVLSGLDLYVTLQPCMMCLQAATYAKINRIYFGAYDLTMPLELPVLSNHSLEIYGGICEESCRELLNNFFITRRE